MSGIIVTGANGFTGRYLVQKLLADGHEVHCFQRHPAEANRQSRYNTHIVDIFDTDAMTAAVRAIQPEAVFHLAAIAFVAHGDVENIYRTNVIGARNLLQSLLVAGGNLRTVALASSANIYGNQSSGAIDESCPFSPTNDYAVSKVAMELVANLYSDRLPITIVRPFNYTGVGQGAQFIIPKIVDHFRRRKAEIELGDVTVERDFSDVRDVVARYAKLLELGITQGEVFNVCSGRSVSLRQIIDMTSNISGHELEVRTNPAFLRQGEVRSLYGDDRKLREFIGPLDSIQFEETLRWMLAQ